MTTSRTAVLSGSLASGDVPRFNGSDFVAANLSGGTVIYDAFGNRPAAGTAGRIFVPSDNGFNQIDTGSEWRNLIRGAPFPEPPAAATFGTQSNFGTSTITKANGVLTIDVQSNAARQIRTAGLAVADPTNPSITFGLDVMVGTILSNTSTKVASGIGGAGVYMKRAATPATMALILIAKGADSGSPFISFEYWNNTGSQAAFETMSRPTQHMVDGGMPPLYRLRYIAANSRIYADMSPDRGNTWIQLYQSPNSDFLGGNPTEFGVLGYTDGTGFAPAILGRFWHCNMVGG